MIHLLIAAALAQSSPANNTPCPTDATSAGHLCRAVAAQADGKFAESANGFEAAAGLAKTGDPAADRMLAAAGNMWIAAGQPGKASLAIDRALAGTGLLADQRGLALLDRARAAEAQNDLKTARAKITEATKTINEDPFLWYFSAALAIRENDVPAAKIAINRALTMIPNGSTVLFEAGHVYQAAGEDSKAREYWTRAAAADPNSPSGQAAKRALGMLAVPLTVTNQIAKQPDGDGEGPGHR
ncbi:MAG: tetratricopeptide repeat protein [Sphingomicrobium sp.]